MIYFDNGATTPIDPRVLDTFVKVSQNYPGNPSSLHQLGRKATEVLELSRQQIKDILNLKNREVLFTSGGSEGDNLIIKGVAHNRKLSGHHIIVSAIEHAAVLNAAKQLEKEGFEVTYLSPDKNGQIRPETLSNAIRNDTILVSIMAVNNETGAIQPLNELSDILQKYPQIVFHVDAVQAVGKQLESIYLNDRIDFLSFSGHKFRGPKGIGFVIYHPNRHFDPLIAGGGQENGLRGGTENIPAIAAMAKALRLSFDNINQCQKKYIEMKNILLNFLDKDPDFYVISKNSKIYTPSIISFALIGVKGETVIHYLEAQETFISTTSACSSNRNQPSHVLMAMKEPDEVIKGELRVSLGPQNDISEMKNFVNQLEKMKDKLKVFI